MTTNAELAAQVAALDARVVKLEAVVDTSGVPDTGHGEWPNTPEGEVDVARFDQMVKDTMAQDIPGEGRKPTREEAEAMANAYLDDMKHGRRDQQGNPIPQ